jgi:hypothetical protein
LEFFYPFSRIRSLFLANTQMPVLATSASDFTAWTRSNSVLPTAGKAAKSTLTTVNVAIAAIVATASKVSVTAAPKTSIYVAPTVKSIGNRKGD